MLAIRTGELENLLITSKSWRKERLLKKKEKKEQVYIRDHTNNQFISIYSKL